MAEKIVMMCLVDKKECGRGKFIVTTKRARARYDVMFEHDTGRFPFIGFPVFLYGTALMTV